MYDAEQTHGKSVKFCRNLARVVIEFAWGYLREDGPSKSLVRKFD